MSEPDPPSPHDQPQDEPANDRLIELVAYLDGELEDQETERLERQLVHDPTLRNYVERLDRTWRLLENLDGATASGAFTERTLASIESVPEESASESVPFLQRLRFTLGSMPWLKMSVWMLIGFAGGSLGLLASRSAYQDAATAADQRLLNNLEFLRDYRKFRAVPSTEFIRQLSAAAPGTAETGEGRTP